MALTGLVDEIKKELSGVKSKIEKQKAADEQMKLRKLQVSFNPLDIFRRGAPL